MVISAKAVYHLLDRFTIRRSLSGYIATEMSEDIFNSSLVMAIDLEDYYYADVMKTKIDYYSKTYAFFIHPSSKEPVILRMNEDLSPLEFVLLCCKCKDFIDKAEFLSTYEAQAINQGLTNTQVLIDEFNTAYDIVCEQMYSAPPYESKDKK